MSSITVLAPSLGPLLGALLLLIIDWQSIFLFLAGWGVISLALLIWKMPKTCDEPIPMNIKNICKSYWNILTNWQFMQPTLGVFLLFISMVAWITVGPFLIMEKFGYSPIFYAIMQGLVFSCFISGNHVSKFLINKHSHHSIAILGITVASLGGIVSLFFALILHNYLIDIILPMSIIALGAGLALPVLNRATIENSEKPMGMKVAIFASATGVGALASSAIVSLFYDSSVISFAKFLLFVGLATVALYFNKIKFKRNK